MSEDKKFYSTLTGIPRLNVGDRVFRKNLIGQYEEAMVVSILSATADSEDWSGTLMTKNGVEYVSGYVEHRTPYDWMPIGWVYDEVRVGWFPPKSILRDDASDAEIEDPIEAQNIAASNVFVVPSPWEGEKYMSWQSRVLKSVPELKGNTSVKAKLSESWKSKQYEITL
tara:strand:+ start:1235 stop:1741 length:507 start_codon:yes stop_codon:yes gene_type:complete